MSLASDFFKISTCNASVGDIVVFWSDLWGLGVIKWRFPQMFSFANRRNASVQKFLSVDIQQNFNLPLFVMAVEQFHELISLLDEWEPGGAPHDEWSYI